MEYVVARVSQQGHHHLLSDESSVAADHRPTPVSQRTRSSAMTQQRRRQALEQEVAELKQQLSNQETVHQILERALQPSSARSALLTIPAFIPTKAKELLAELLVVEEEIARLEDQIQAMKNGGGGNVNRAAPAAVPEIKSMFFISQAMDMAMIKTGTTTQQQPPLNNNNSNNNKAAAAAAKAMSSSPKTSRRHSIEGRRHPPALPPSPPPPKAASSSSKLKSSSGSSAANKLSERIVKCLLCIFIRLLRSSRVADLDSTSRNLQQQQQAFTLNLATAAAAAKDKQDRGQQDHYGIFAIPDAIVRDVGPYKNLVRFSSLDLDLRGGCSPLLLTKLRQMLEALQQVDLKSSLLNHQQKLAFWINVYNTCIMHGILQHGLPSNSDKLLALKNKATINVSGQTFNALVIENFILRQPSSVKEEFWKCDVDVEEQQVRELYGLKSSEPNILFALCCGIRSSPALRIYKADRVSMDLEKAKLEYLQASLVVTSTRRLLIPGLIHSNMHDFAKDMESLLRWICEQLPTSWSLRKSMVDCLRHLHLKMETEVVDVDVIPLDYEFQYLLPM